MILKYLIPAALLSLFSCTSEDKNQVIQESQQQDITAKFEKVNSKEAKTLLTNNPDMQIIDVRTPQEYAEGHLKDAQNLNYNDPAFKTELAKLDKNKTYLVYCASGGRSNKSLKMMEQLGFKTVYDATGGYNSLESSGVPVE